MGQRNTNYLGPRDYGVSSTIIKIIIPYRNAFRVKRKSQILKMNGNFF